MNNKDVVEYFISATTAFMRLGNGV